MDPIEFRKRVQETLELISSRDSQLEYQARVPFVDVASELFNQWDDFYHPGDAVFRSAFTSEELVALEEFARVLESVAASSPKKLPPIADFAVSVEGRLLARSASEARKKLDPT